MKIAIVISRLGVGGAERQLVALSEGLAERGHCVNVIVLFGGGEFENLLPSSRNVCLTRLFASRSKWSLVRLFAILFGIRRLRRTISRSDPDVIYGMLNFANLFCWVATRGSLSRRLVWSNRNTWLARSYKHRITERLCAALSRSVPLMICNSHAGKQFLQSINVNARNTVVVHNGIDTNRFTLSETTGKAFRDSIGVGRSDPLVAIVARLDRKKNHFLFLRSAVRILETLPNCRFVCVGTGNPQYRTELKSYGESLGLDGILFWVDAQSDPVPAYNAIDVLVSISTAEGFSNVIAEAMACGTPCVVSDIGDSGAIVGDCGVVLRSCDEANIAEGVLKLLRSNPGATGKRARCRVVETFSVEKLVDNTEAAFALLAR